MARMLLLSLSLSLLSPLAACGDDDGTSTDGGPERDGGTTPIRDASLPPLDGRIIGTPMVSCTSPEPAHTAAEQMLVDLPQGTWWQAPSTHLEDECPIPCNGIIDAWSGGAYDPVHNRFLLFGGGHADYSGNELYGFDLATLSWTRMTEPSPSDLANQDPLPDGQPVSRHSYDGLEYLTHANLFLAHGGSRWQDGSGTDVTWTFETETTTWRNMEPADEPPFTNCCSEGAAYDPGSGLAFFHLTSRLASYDVDANRWNELTDLTYPPYWPRYEAWGEKVGLVDTRRSLLWFLGAGLVLVYDIAAGEYVTEDWVTTGGAPYSNAEAIGDHTEQVFETTGGEVVTAQGPGVDYDPVADDIVAWVGGGAWALDLDTRVWSRQGDTGAPAEPVGTGTYGRWRYIPRTNVFILVNGVDEDVYFYKHTAGCGE